MLNSRLPILLTRRMLAWLFGQLHVMRTSAQAHWLLTSYRYLPADDGGPSNSHCPRSQTGVPTKYYPYPDRLQGKSPRDSCWRRSFRGGKCLARQVEVLLGRYSGTSLSIWEYTQFGSGLRSRTTSPRRSRGLTVFYICDNGLYTLFCFPIRYVCLVYEQVLYLTIGKSGSSWALRWYYISI